MDFLWIIVSHLFFKGPLASLTEVRQRASLLRLQRSGQWLGGDTQLSPRGVALDQTWGTLCVKMATFMEITRIFRYDQLNYQKLDYSWLIYIYIHIHMHVMYQYKSTNQ